MTFFEIVNKMLEASRNGDVILKRFYQDLMTETEPTYADTLDLINY